MNPIKCIILPLSGQTLLRKLQVVEALGGITLSVCNKSSTTSGKTADLKEEITTPSEKKKNVKSTQKNLKKAGYLEEKVKVKTSSKVVDGAKRNKTTKVTLSVGSKISSQAKKSQTDTESVRGSQGQAEQMTDTKSVSQSDAEDEKNSEEKTLKHNKTVEALNFIIDDLASSLMYINRCSLIGDSGQTSQNAVESFKEFIDKYSSPLLPSVTRVIQDTMSDMNRYYLDRWKNQMIEQLGLEGFEKYRQETFAIGQNFHGSIGHLLEGKSLQEIQLMPKNEGHLESLEKILPQIQEVYAIEKMVKHQTLFYQGKFDCVVKYRNSICVIDWKTSSKPKPTLSDTYDNPVQLAAYVGALNSSQLLRDKGVKQVTNAAVVVAYSNGDPAHVHIMNKKMCEEYWKRWQQRLHQYWEQKAPKRLRNQT